MKNRTVNNLIRRYLTLLVGLFIMSFGVAFSIKAGLGTSPVSSIPYVLSMILPMTVGETTILVNCCLVIIQILLLRRQFELVQLIQVPVAIAFGYLTDLAVWVLSSISRSPTGSSGCSASWASCWWVLASALRSPPTWSPWLVRAWLWLWSRR